MKRIKFMNKQIDLKSIIHYILIYLMLICGGTAWSDFMGNDLFVLVVFFVPLCFIIRQKKIETKYLIMFVCYTLFCLLAMTYSTLSIGTYMNVGGKLLIAYAVVCYDKEKFLDRFLKTSMFLCFMSLLIYAVTQMVGFENMEYIYTKLYTDAMAGSYEKGNGYGLLLYRFVPLHSLRNCGMFTEPGEHAVFLNVVLYFLLVHAKKEEFPYRNIALIIVVLCIITCRSTAGYFMLLSNVVFVTFSKKNHFAFDMKMWIGVVLAIIVFRDYILSLFDSVVVEKIMKEGMIDLSQGTSGVRYSSIKSVLSYINTNPKAIFGIGFEGIQSTSIGTCAGLLAVLLAVGVFAFSAIYIYMIGNSFWYKKDLFDFFMQISIVLIAGLSQPATAFPVVFILSIYPMFKNKIVRAEKEFMLHQE